MHNSPISAGGGYIAETSSSTAAPQPQPHPDTAGDDVEITLDVAGGSVAAPARCVELPRPGGGAGEGGSDSSDAIVAVEKRRPSPPHAGVSATLKRELRRAPRFDRSKTAAAHALSGLRFISGAHADEGWAGVERRFDRLTEKQDGILYGSQFGQCIGMKPMEQEEGKGKKKEDKADKKKGEKRSPWCSWNRDEMKSEKVAETEAGTEKRPDFAGVLFDALTRQRGIIPGDGITKAEMRGFWDRISDTSFDSRLQTFFDMVDKDADGRITEEEIKEIITLTASENKLLAIREQAADYARLIMEAMDPAGLGYIELHQLETLLLLAPTQLEHGDDTTGNDSHLSRLLSLRPPEPNPLGRWCRRARYFLDDNWRGVWVVLLWLSVCAALFAWKFIQYRRRYVFHVMGYCVCVAKGGAETLKLNMALILLPVCRNTLTWIRDLAAAARVIPFDDNLTFHKVVAAGIAAGVALHAVPHLTCDFPRLLHATDAEYAPLAQYFATSKDRRPPNYWWFVRGTEGWTGLVMVALMAAAFTLATPWFRRGYLQLRRPALLRKMTPGFNAFWYSHHGFVVVYALLIVHGHHLYLTREWHRKTTWMYLAVPMAVYAGERLTRTVRSRARPVTILKAIEYPGNVLSLRFSTQPHDFRYKSGQYVFVKCPAVSPLQWHPFSITSAPQDEYVSIHIRVLGDWTGDLKKIFSATTRSDKVREQVRVVYDCNDPTTNSSHDMEDKNNKRLLPEVLIDGPYGAPAQDYKQYDIVLLIGNGIGATPMVSIIKDIINTMKQQQADGDLEAGGSSGNTTGASTAPPAMDRAYFYWVTREQGTFAWFRGVMDEAARTDKKGVIELHSYCTSVHKEGDARSAVVTMLQSISHAKNGVDVVTGSRVRAHFGRPNWRRVYEGIAQNHPDKRVGVFCSGAKVLTKELRKLAQEFSQKTSTKFEFHKENF